MKKQKLNYILEEVRKKGRNGDTILAHINPIEAIMLKQAGGSGTINPKTGLPEFGGFFSKNYWKKGAWKRDAATAAGVIVGNMILPGAGGIVGGALGGAAGTAIRGRKDYTPAMIKGAIAGATLPTAASIAGSGANALGAKSLGTSLANYGSRNAILPSIGLGEKTSTALKGASGTNAIISAMGSSGKNSHGSDHDYLEHYQDYLKENGVGGKGNTEELSFFDKLKGNTENFLTKPKNLLALGSTGLQLYDRMNQPKPLTPAQKGRAAKEEMLAARLTPQELAEQEQYELALEQAKRRNARKKFLPEERIDITPLYNRVSSPEEYAQTGRWINYYNNPQFTGQPIRF